MKHLIFTLIALFFLTSCITYGPDAEKKSILNTLNGENYETPTNAGPDTLLVPFAKKKERLTHITGVVLLDQNSVLDVPLNHISLEILDKNGVVLQNTTTQNNGKFDFSGVFQNGEYEIRSRSEKYSGSIKIEVKSYNIDKLIIKAKQK